MSLLKEMAPDRACEPRPGFVLRIRLKVDGVFRLPVR